MLLRLSSIFAALLFAVIILSISVFRLSAPNYAFYQPPNPGEMGSFTTDVGYYFPSPGIMPDSPFWAVKAIRDKIWLAATIPSQKRARLLLLFADKRVVMSEDLMKTHESSLSVATAEKAEQYLEDSYNVALKAEYHGEDTTELLTTIAKSSLRHRETLEYIITIAPQDAVPMLNKAVNTPKRVYDNCIQKLLQNNKPVPTPYEK